MAEMSGLGLAGRIIALDMGTVRIGVAVSDPMRLFAQGVAVLKAGGDWVNELTAIIAEYEVGFILVGLPRRTDGSEGSEAATARETAELLAGRFPELTVLTWDERFTTVIANKVLLEADVSRAGRKARVDKIAAAVLLQSYLDSIRTNELPAIAPMIDIPQREQGRGGKKGKGYR